MKCSLLERLGFQGHRIAKEKISKIKLEIHDWNIKEFQSKIQIRERPLKEKAQKKEK